MILKICKTTDPILRKPVENVVNFDFELQELIDNMIETMRKNNGIGLAAPQVGLSKNILVCEFDGKEKGDLPGFPLTVICNPKITHFSEEKKKMVEGCLSFPGLEILVKRPENILIEGQDRYGKKIEIKAGELYARVLQHEFDHLNSTLLIDHIEEIGIIFIGTGTLGEKALELLANDIQYKIKLVVTGETNKVIRRNAKEKTNPILEVAKKHKLPYLLTKNIKDEKVIETIKKLKPDLGVMADFGQIIPKTVLDIPKHGVINIHPSLLPKYRGPSPVQQTILEGDKIAGVSLILTSEKMDAGGVIARLSVELTGSETSTILKDYLGQAGASLLLNSIPYYMAGDLKPVPQKEEKAIYCNLFKAEDGFVDSNTEAKVVEKKIRAFDVWPKVYTLVNDKRVQILSAHFEEDGTFTIDRVKPEGKNEMSYADFKNGYKAEIKFKE